MSFQPSDSLRSRTFIGLLIAQFFAAFNDQFIHAAAMFYAINQKAMTEAQAISLMPILFYLPWVLFPTVAGYLADRFSKRHTLVFWKFAEVAICLVALAGFWLGTERNSDYGPLVVLATVFLMGTHSAFFVPAKYGVMPEILRPHLLSKGNGLLESLSFLAIILGTVTGGVLSTYCDGRETLIGIVLVGLAIVGALASLLIEAMPAADPHRRFPRTVYGPLFANVRTMVRSKPLGLAVLGIAFFTFVVAFMRMAIYMHGEAQVPAWSELKTSVIVGMTSLGIGLGSPLAGWLSGNKVEVGLVPLGGLGMIVATLLTAAFIGLMPGGWLPGLAFGIVLIGFFTGFYLVPMFTLLQQRAPKASKGDLVATNNCLSVAGAILASIVFFVVENGAEKYELAAVRVAQAPVVTGTLEQLTFLGGRPEVVAVRDQTGRLLEVGAADNQEVLLAKKGLFHRLEKGDEVDVGTYRLEAPRPGEPAQVFFTVRARSGDPLPPAYDKSRVPRYLFVGAAVITLLILILLRLRLPDLFLRSALWRWHRRRARLSAVATTNVPGDAPVVLATDARTVEACLYILASTDRYTRFLLPGEPSGLPLVLRSLLRFRSLGVLGEGADVEKALGRVLMALAHGQVVAFPDVGDPRTAHLLREVGLRSGAEVVPATCVGEGNNVRVVFGEPLPPGTTPDAVAEAVRRTATAAG